MVLTKNPFPKRRGRPPKNQLALNHELQQTTFKGTNDSAIKPVLKNGKFTFCNITLIETSVNDRILRVPLNRYNLNALKDINCKPKTSSFGRSIKRKKDSDFVSNQIHRTRKKLRVNGSSINESIHQLSDIPKTSLQSYSNTKSVKKEENIDKDTLMTKSVEAEQIPNENQLESNILGSLKTFITKTSKIKLNSKTIKGNEKQVLRQPHTISNTVSKQVHCKSNTTKSIQKPLKNKVVPSYGVGTYYLKFNKEKILTEGRFNYKFQKLVTDVKNMNLPSVRWKIKVIIRQNKISAITFTNKQELERSVTFASEKDKYKLLIDNKSAYLLGSPETIDSPEDIEILLEILEQLDSDSPIILYR